MTDEVGQATPLTEEQVKEQLQALVGAGKWVEAKPLLTQLLQFEKAREAVAKAALQTKLNETTNMVRDTFGLIIAIMTGGEPASKDALNKVRSDLTSYTGKELDGADGIWIARDFGDSLNSNFVRITRAAKKATGEGGGGKSSYVTDPRKSADMLAAVGSQVMFDKDTTVTIDKTEQVMPAGTTLQQAYDYSTNGGWRNRVRQALLKAADKAQAA